MKLRQQRHYLAYIELHSQKHVSAIILTEGCVFTHMHNCRPNTPFFFGPLFDPLWFHCLCPIWKCYQAAGQCLFIGISLPLFSPCCCFVMCWALVDSSISKTHTSRSSKAQLAFSSLQSLHLGLTSCLDPSFSGMQ